MKFLPDIFILLYELACSNWSNLGKSNRVGKVTPCEIDDKPRFFPSLVRSSIKHVPNSPLYINLDFFLETQNKKVVSSFFGWIWAMTLVQAWLQL